MWEISNDKNASQKSRILPITLAYFLTLALAPLSTPLGSAEQPDLGKPASAGFWDEGFRAGTVRTDYQTRDEGTKTNPLTLVPCLYPKRDDSLLGPAGASAVGASPCAMGPAQFQTSNPYTNADG